MGAVHGEAMNRDNVEVLTVRPEASGKERLAGHLAAIGRGPGRSRPLTEAEAEDALSIVLSGAADPIQVGALLLLMRYRGETAPELAGLVRAARRHIEAPPVGEGPVDLDWPSYAAGRSRGAPWFLLSALLVARAGHRVLLHGFNSAHLRGTGTEMAARAIGVPVCATLQAARAALAEERIAYVPLERLSPELHRLMTLRNLLGLRSPVNSLVRLLNPLGATASLVGVFHPPYRELHRDSAQMLGFRQLAVVKGGGGEAELNPFKPLTVHRLIDGEPLDWDMPAAIADSRGERAVKGTLEDWLAVWRGDARDEAAEATVIATAALALATLAGARSEEERGAAWQQAERLWRER